jgi:hypothetical protein
VVLYIVERLKYCPLSYKGGGDYKFYISYLCIIINLTYDLMMTTQRFSKEALELRQELEAKREQGVYTMETSRSALKPVRDDGGKFYQCYEQNDDYKDKEGNIISTVVHFIEKDGDYHSGHVIEHENGFLRTV